MAKEKFNSSVVAEAKMLFIDKELSCAAISRQLGGSPTAQCVQQWSKRIDKATGKSWVEEKAERASGKYKKLSPESQAKKIFDFIDKILNVDYTQLDAKGVSSLADALRKTQRSMEHIVNKSFQLPMLFEFLEKFALFLKKFYPALITPELINAMKHFKNDLRKELEAKL